MYLEENIWTGEQEVTTNLDANAVVSPDPEDMF